MAFQSGSKQKIVWSGFDLTAFSRGLDVEPSVDVADTTVFGLSSKTYITGLKDARVSLEGLLDGAATGNDVRLFADLAATAIAGLVGTSFPQGDALGNVGYGFLAHEVSLKVTTPVADVSQLSASFQVTGGVDRIKSQHALAAEVGAVNSASIDNAASSADGGVGYLHADGGGSSLTSVWKVQHSTDNSVWVDLITFATVTNATRTSERKTVTGTVNRYTRATNDATTNGAKVQVSFGRT